MSHTDNDNSFLERVELIIYYHLKDINFGVEELASAIPMHRNSFSRKISELTGQNPSELIEVMRMTEAWDLITSTDIPISQITFEVGFTELSNFSRAFKRHFGDSPSNVRNSSD